MFLFPLVASSQRSGEITPRPLWIQPAHCVIISSVSPSLKYSCVRSSLRFSKGSTASLSSRDRSPRLRSGLRHRRCKPVTRRYGGDVLLPLRPAPSIPRRTEMVRVRLPSHKTRTLFQKARLLPRHHRLSASQAIPGHRRLWGRAELLARLERAHGRWVQTERTEFIEAPIRQLAGVPG